MSAYNVTYVIEDCSVIFIHMVDFSHFNFSNSETLILQKKKKMKITWNEDFDMYMYMQHFILTW